MCAALVCHVCVAGGFRKLLKSQEVMAFISLWEGWCARVESNHHSFRNTDLNRARLPIPPRARRGPHPALPHGWGRAGWGWKAEIRRCTRVVNGSADERQRCMANPPRPRHNCGYVAALLTPEGE